MTTRVAPPRKTKPKADWARVEAEYRAGAVTVREIARQNGVSEGRIRQKAKAGEWKRDLAARYQAEVQNRVIRSHAETVEGVDPKNDEQVIAAAASVGEHAVKGHLARTKRLKAQLDRLMELFELWLNGDDVQRAYAAERIFASKGDGVGNISRAVADISERIQKLERASLNLDSKDPGGQTGAEVTLEDRLNAYRREDSINRAENVVRMKGAG